MASSIVVLPAPFGPTMAVVPRSNGKSPRRAPSPYDLMFSSSTLVTCIASPNAPAPSPRPARDGSRAGGQLLLQLLPQPVRRADGRRRLAQLDRDLFGERRVEGRPGTQAAAPAPARGAADTPGRPRPPPDAP